MFPKEVKPILENCVNHRETLSSIFRFGGSRDQSVFRFLIHGLGRIGDVTTLSVLRGMADDAAFGKDAIEAIDAIEKNLLSERTSHAVL